MAEHEDVIPHACDAGTSTNEHDGPPCGPPAAHTEAPGEGPPGSPGGDPEQVLVEALAEAVAQCRAAGREHAARVAWEALGKLLAQPAPADGSEADGASPVVQLRRDR